jgi:hypothetical protein
MSSADPTTKDGRVAIKMDDTKYLRSHPELRWLIDKFMEVRAPGCERADRWLTRSRCSSQGVLLDKPADVETYARDFFTRSGHKDAYMTTLKTD